MVVDFLHIAHYIKKNYLLNKCQEKKANEAS